MSILILLLSLACAVGAFLAWYRLKDAFFIYLGAGFSWLLLTDILAVFLRSEFLVQSPWRAVVFRCLALLGFIHIYRETGPWKR